MQKSLEKISVIIPCYNAENFIQECIESILRQDYINTEIIVVDDGSTDKSISMLTPFLDKIILITQKNLGACVARNKGLEVASGDFIKFLDADDYLVDGILTSQADKLRQLDDRSIVFGDLVQQHLNHSNIRSYNTFDNEKMIETLILTGVITSSPLHRTTLLKEVNGFDPRFKNGQEWNMHIRLAASGVKFIYDPQLVYHQRFHDSPDRISNQKAVIDWDYQINKRLMTLNSIAELTKVTDSIKQAIAFNIWNIGRRALIQDDKLAAKKCFTISKKIYSDINEYLSVSNRIMSLFIGKELTEHVTYYRKKFTKWRKKITKKK